MVTGSKKKLLTAQHTVKVLNRDKYLILMVFPGCLLMIIFRYIPIYGIAIAFQDYHLGTPFFGANEWVGLKYFLKFINGPYFFRLMRNTFLLGFYSLLIGFPLPIILALSFHDLRNGLFKRVAQTASYLPHFVSTVVIIGITRNLLDIQNGKINDIIQIFGGDRIKFFAEAGWFRTIYIGTGIWMGLGFSAIIYLAALSGVDPQLYESATIDGAGKLMKVWHISLPSILPTILVLLILSVGGLFGTDIQKILLIYQPSTYSISDVIGTYVYRRGIENAEFSYSTAVSLFINMISFIFLFGTNMLSRKISGNSLW